MGPGSDDIAARFARIRDEFFDDWARRHPDEAGTLGILDGGGEGPLGDPSRAAIEEEAGALRATLAEIEAIDMRALDREAQLDAWAIAAWSRHEVRQVERGAHLANVERGLLPYHLLRHLVIHAGDALEADDVARVARARIEEIPRFLASHERTLAAGIAEGMRAHAGTIEWIAERSIPALAAALAALPREHAWLDAAACAGAARAYSAHAAFLRERAAEGARATGAIGEDEARFRLGRTMGLEGVVAEGGADALEREARACLAEAHERMIACAAELGADGAAAGRAHDLAAVRAAVIARWSEPLVARDDEVLPAFRRLLAEATAFARAHGLVPLGDDVLRVEIAPLPPAIAEAGHAQNWAAPLRSRAPRAHFLAAERASAHPAMAAPQLAVHEGVPGHSLQSLCFARAHGRSRSPVRFLAVADDVAMARSWFGAMLSIEGWATWVEHRLLELGFHRGPALVFGWNVRAIRAARVIADLAIHRGTMSPDEAREFLVREAMLPEAVAAREVARYQRIPLQALTYLTGAQAIERALARGVSIDALLGAGPIPPDLL